MEIKDIIGTILGLTILYIFIVYIINWVCYFSKFSIKIPIRKKWKTKVNPIYELHWEGWCGYYNIRKWKLGWNKNEDSILQIFIPFYGLFSFYRYWLEETEIGSFKESDVVKITDLKLEYETRFEKSLEKDWEDWKIWVEKTSAIDKLNKTFKENYE